MIMSDAVLRLEAAALGVPQVDCPVQHYFAPGLFAREISIPAGTVVVGAMHKTQNIVIVSKGRLRMVTDGGVKEVCAGETFIVQPGVKNAVVAIEDSRWTNIMHNPGNETDIEVLAEVFTHSKACELLGGSQNKQLLAAAELQKVEA